MRKVFLFLILAMCCFVFGCKSENSDEVTKVTEQQAKQQAKQDITTENLDQELTKMQKEIESDLSSEQ